MSKKKKKASKPKQQEVKQAESQEIKEEVKIPKSVGGVIIEDETVVERKPRDPKEDLKGFARMKAEMEGMSPFKKVLYFLDYTKVYFIIGILLIIWVVSFIRTQNQNTLPTAISYAILNTGNHSTAYETEDPNNPFMKYAEDMGYTEPGTFQFQGNASIELSAETQKDDYVRSQESSANVMQFGGLLDKDFYDIIITDEPGLEYLVQGEDAIRIKTVKDTIGDLADKEGIKDRVLTMKDATGTEYDVAIDISDREFTKELDLPYEKVYLCFGGASDENKENAKSFVEYIFK